MTPNTSTILSWFFYLIPVYLFVIAPFLQQIFPPDEPSSSSTSPSTSIWGADLDHESIQYDAEGNEIPGLNLEDDSFISPEDDVPVDCAVDGNGDGGYKTHILSREPLVIYIEGFLSEREADHLVDVRFVSLFPVFPVIRLRYRVVVQSAKYRGLTVYTVSATTNPP